MRQGTVPACCHPLPPPWGPSERAACPSCQDGKLFEKWLGFLLVCGRGSQGSGWTWAAPPALWSPRLFPELQTRSV